MLGLRSRYHRIALSLICAAVPLVLELGCSSSAGRPVGDLHYEDDEATGGESAMVDLPDVGGAGGEGGAR